MKFTNSQQFLKALNAMVRDRWDIKEIHADNDSLIQKVVLKHSIIGITYVLEYHRNQESFNLSKLDPFKSMTNVPTYTGDN